MIKELQTIFLASRLNPWILFILALAFFASGMIVWHHDSRSLKNGWLLNLTFYALIGFSLLLSAAGGSFIFRIVLTATALLGMLLVALALYSALTLVAWSFKLSANKKYRARYHFATDLVIAIFLIICLLLLITLLHIKLPAYLTALFAFGPLFTIYLAFVFANFLTQTILINLKGRRAAKQAHSYDYLIILGAGLINGNQISASLAQRIKTALNFAKYHGLPVIIASGGKGSDEKLSEAAAIRQNLIQSGYPADKIREENLSTNTWENFQNSIRLIRQEHGHQQNPPLRLAFVSNSYHLTRASYFALKANIHIIGIPAKTPRNYIASGWFREFAAMLLIKKRQQGLVLLLFLSASLLMAILAW